VSAESLPTDRLIGEVLAQRYEILHRLGEGAMGAVYKARHVKVGRPFAVKVLHTRVLEDAKVVKRFEREAELAGRLRHANVVGVVDVGEIDGMRYMVMDYAEGPDLAQLLDEAPMPPARIIHLVRQLLEGLYHAHEQGLIHRDFKPENVIVERDSHGAELPRIVDFGISILRDGGTGVDQEGRLTTNGLVLGTPHYMAPEQAVADPIDHRIDLFALGIVVYEMLSGRLPYDGNGAEVARANLLLDPPPISQRVPYLEVDPLLEAFARRLMAKKRDGRPPTAKSARELLDLIERDRPGAAAALGLAPSMSTRGPAVTVPVPPQAQQAGPPGHGSPAPPPWRDDQATTSMRSPGVAGPLLEAPGGPTPLNAPRLAIDPRAPIDERDVETSRRVPLGWEDASPPRRCAPWFVGGSVLGVAGIVLAVAFIRGAPGEPTEPGEDRIVMTPVEPTPSSAPGSSSQDVAASPTPSSSDPLRSSDPPTAEPVEDSAALHRATEPIVVSDRADHDATTTRAATRGSTPRGRNAAKSADAKITASRANESPSTNAAATRSGDAKLGNAGTGEAHAAEPRTEARADNARTGDARPATASDARPASASTARPVAKPQKVTGLTANELSDFYASVGRELSALPGPAAQDLWSRLLLIKIQELMAAPQSRRDEAARQLQLIHQEAVLRKP
jgi:serine/threonine protein kinase